MRAIGARMKGTARVRSAKTSPRSERRRNASAPMPTASSAETMPAIGIVVMKSQPWRTVRTAAAYTPTPKKAPCPKLK